jgi:hypothetical protein
MPKSKTAALVPIERITQSILILRGHKVLVDSDLAALYGVETGVLIQAVNATATDSRKISCCN